jgi:uridylate kinase
MKTVVVSLGGSLVAPNGVDTDFLREFLVLLREQKNTQFVIVVGGGRPAREYQAAAKAFGASSTDLDWVGIRATYLNAELVRASLGASAYAHVITDPTKPPRSNKKFLVACGWKPGRSTDYDAVLLATKYNTTCVLNLSNIDWVYDADPRIQPGAKKYTALSWKTYQSMIGTTWDPGKNCPFDPVASSLARKHRIRVIICNGRNGRNVRRVLNEEPFDGTTLG